MGLEGLMGLLVTLLLVVAVLVELLAIAPALVEPLVAVLPIVAEEVVPPAVLPPKAPLPEVAVFEDKPPLIVLLLLVVVVVVLEPLVPLPPARLAAPVVLPLCASDRPLTINVALKPHRPTTEIFLIIVFAPFDFTASKLTRYRFEQWVQLEQNPANAQPNSTTPVPLTKPTKSERRRACFQ